MKKEMMEQDLTQKIIGAAIEVHRHWGPGLYEQTYERSLCREFELREIPFECQKPIPLVYKGVAVGEDFRLDILVRDKVVIELKAVTELAPIHEAQLLTYMKIAECRVGLLINFDVPVLKKGIRRMVL